MLPLFKLGKKKKREEGKRKGREKIEKTKGRVGKTFTRVFLFAGNRDELGRFLNSYPRGNFGTGSGDYFKRNVLKAAMTRSVMRI